MQQRVCVKARTLAWRVAGSSVSRGDSPMKSPSPRVATRALMDGIRRTLTLGKLCKPCWCTLTLDKPCKPCCGHIFKPTSTPVPTPPPPPLSTSTLPLLKQHVRKPRPPFLPLPPLALLGRACFLFPLRASIS